jgi:hypothetical protein
MMATGTGFVQPPEARTQKRENTALLPIIE